MTKRKNYRYILCGLVNYDDPISDFRLIAGNNMIGCISGCVRVAIPEDMKLEKWKCDSYSTTYDKRTLRELNAEAMVWTKSGWTVVPGLLDRYQPHEWFTKLPEEGWDYNHFCYTKPKRFRKPKILYIQPDLPSYLSGSLFNKNDILSEHIYFYESNFLDPGDTRYPIALKIELSPFEQIIEIGWNNKRYKVQSEDKIKLYKLSTMVRTKSGLLDVTEQVGIIDDYRVLIRKGWIPIYKDNNPCYNIDYLNPPKDIILEIPSNN